MSIDIINQTIQYMCSELASEPVDLSGWQMMSEEELLYEAAICICGSQLLFELAVAIVDRLRDDGLLKPEKAKIGLEDLQKQKSASLGRPVSVVLPDGLRKDYRPRFKNRLASLVASTMHGLYSSSNSLHAILHHARDARTARKTLVETIFGFGPKQASLYLRRVGYCSELAVIDAHVLSYLQLAKGLTFSPSRLGKISAYEEAEGVFRDIAYSFGHPIGQVDLATWLTMRVAKREAIL